MRSSGATSPAVTLDEEVASQYRTFQQASDVVTDSDEKGLIFKQLPLFGFNSSERH